MISLSESPVLIDMTNDILLHVRGYRQLTIGRQDRTAVSLPEHMAIIEALEERDTEMAEKRARDHTLGLAAYVEAHGQELFLASPPLASRNDLKRRELAPEETIRETSRC